MTSANEPNETIREDLIEALLGAAYADEQSVVCARVDCVMQKIESEQSSLTERSTSGKALPSRRSRRWISLAIAASIVVTLVIGFQIYGPSQYALAAIGQSLAAAAENIARRYQITVSYRDSDQKSFALNNDLYVQGNDRFVLRHPALLPGADLWLGKEGTETWVVPAIGPVRTGDDLALSRWLSSHEELATPYLHITTVLNRMSRGYRLEELGIAQINLQNGSQVECRHVIGRLRQAANQKLPATIELWAAVESGVAQRIEANWKLSAGESGREKVAIELVGEPSLPSDWFRSEGHYSKPRRVLRFDASE